MKADLNKIFKIDYTDAVVKNMIENLGYVHNPDILYDWFNMCLGLGELGGYKL